MTAQKSSIMTMFYCFLLFTANFSTAHFDKPFGINVNGKTISLLCKKSDENITRQWASGSYHYKPGMSFLFFVRKRCLITFIGIFQSDKIFKNFWKKKLGNLENNDKR